MKKLILSIVLVFALSISVSAIDIPDLSKGGKKKRGIGIEIRLYGGAGYTVENLDDAQSAAGNEPNKLNYRGGLQVFYEFSKVSIINMSGGMDVSYLRAASLDATIATATSGAIPAYSQDYLNVTPIVQLKFKDLIFVQFGGGRYFDAAGVAEVQSEWGFLVAAGGGIAITDSISIPAMIRADLILADKTIIPISFLSGVSYSL